jgi:phosphomevalonate kinase
VKVRATAPGKLVVLGEYAVLAGAPALVLAVDRHCQAELGPSEDEHCHLRICAPQSEETSFPVGAQSGVTLVDLVTGADTAGSASAWRGSVDSSGFFDGQTKLGIGSSAAALTTWAAAWSAYTGQGSIARDVASLETLIGLHRALQGGSGSGLDVAASLFGGAITYRLVPELGPIVGSVRLPNSVGFTTVFTGRSASTRDFVAAYDDWRSARPTEAAEQLQALERIAVDGCAAARGNDAEQFLTAVAAYGQRLEVLGECIGAEIVTGEHREIAGFAKQYGVVYKVSGAGGGDLGIALSADPEALAAFKEAVRVKYRVVDFRLDTAGLSVEEQTA